MDNKKEIEGLMFDIATLLERLKKWIEEEYPLYTVDLDNEKPENSKNSIRGQYLLEAAREIVDEYSVHSITADGTRHNYDCIGTVLRCIYNAGYKFNTNLENISDYFEILNKKRWPKYTENHYYNMLGMWDLRSCGEEKNKKSNDSYSAEPGDLLIWQKDHNGQATSHGHVIMYLGVDEAGYSMFLSGSTGGAPRIIEEVDTDITELFTKYNNKYPHYTLIKPALVREKG